MISLHEQNAIFSLANDEMIEKSKLLFEALIDKGNSRILHANEDALSEGFDPDNIYFIKQGVLSAYYQETEIYMLQDHDIFLPEFIPKIKNDEANSDLNYSIKFSLHVQVFTPHQLSEVLEGRADLVQLWIEINSLQQFLCNQTIAVLSPVEERSSPKFECINAGETIIHEDADADYVFTLMEGAAIVIHNDVQVGSVKKDEIFGAMAVLLNQKRTATVMAETDCMVLKVHRDEFSKMILSRPGLFLSLLENLSSKVKNMNIKVSELTTK